MHFSWLVKKEPRRAHTRRTALAWATRRAAQRHARVAKKKKKKKREKKENNNTAAAHLPRLHTCRLPATCPATSPHTSTFTAPMHLPPHTWPPAFRAFLTCSMGPLLPCTLAWKTTAYTHTLPPFCHTYHLHTAHTLHVYLPAWHLTLPRTLQHFSFRCPHACRVSLCLNYHSVVRLLPCPTQVCISAFTTTWGGGGRKSPACRHEREREGGEGQKMMKNEK